MSLAGRPKQLSRREAFVQQEERVRSRLLRLAEKRDSEHRLNVREALAERELARDYAATFGGSVAEGVPVFGVADGIHEFEPSREANTMLAHVNELLASLAFADVTSEYTPTDDTVGTRLLLMRQGRGVASLVAVDDGLLHVWVAGSLRRRGVGSELVKEAQRRFALTHVVGPLNTVRIASRFAATTDLPVRP